MKHYGDITKLSGDVLPIVDVITGGSPCQDLSVAGKRAGLAGERSGLFMEQMRIVKEMRERDVRDNGRTGFAVRPRYMVWENVPGAFSSGNPKGADFAAVIEEIIKVAEPDANVSVCVPNGGWTKSGCYYAEDGSWSIAWRVHDAQFWGVPQRRKRIALVADFGGLSAPEILFERKGLSGDSEPSRAPGEGTARATGGGVASTITASYGTKWNGNAGAYSGGNFVIEPVGGGIEGASGFTNRGYYSGSVAETLRSDPHGAYPMVAEPILLESNQNHATVQTDGISPALPASMGMGGGYVPMVTAYGISSYDSNAMKSPNPRSGVYEADTARTLDLNGGSPACNQGGVAIVQGSYVPDGAHALSARHDGSPQPDKGNGANNVCAGFKGGNGAKASGIGYEEEVSPTLSAAESGTNQTPCVYDARGNGDGDTVPTLTGDHGNRVTDYTALCIGNGQLNQVSMAEQANTLDTMHDQQAVMVAAVDCRNATENADVNGTLQAKEQGQNLNSNNVCRCGSVVRRLTPLECERLQGYPDGWTDIGEWTDTKGKKHKPADSPRYKALGNSIALPFWAWLARRICAQYERPATLASLFDGIGGFPLVFSRSGAVPVWASEIEEFPIAVTKKHFPEE